MTLSNWANRHDSTEIDTSRMIDRILDFPTDIAKAVEAVKELQIPSAFRSSRLVLFTGMGGSGIPGDFFKKLYENECRIPLFVNKDYGVPAYVGPDTLVFAVSYSGTTEETVDGCLEAIGRRAHIIGITSGDRLLEVCQDNRLPYFLAPSGRTTRDSFAYVLFPLIAIMQHLGFIPPQDAATAEAIRVCAELASICQPTTPTPDNIAKALAESLFGRLPVIYGSYNCTRPVALRWNQQFNENSKVFAHSATFPDFTHNEIVAYGVSAQFTKSISAIFLRDQDEPTALQRRILEAQKILRQARADVVDIQSKGDSKLARILYLSYLGDFASYYLALLHGVDPTQTAQMSALKRDLGLTDLTPGLERA